MPDYKEQTWEGLTHFTDKQKEASGVANKHRYTLFGGSAGPGKSYWLRWYAIERLIRWYNKTNQRGIHAGLFCEDYPSLKDRQIIKIQYEFPSWLGDLKESSLEGLGFFLKNEYGGGVLSLRNLDDPSKFLSAEYALVAIDELTRNPKDVFNVLRTRLRWPEISDAKFIAATNPGGPGHEWVKKIWIDKQFDENEVDQPEFAYVKALPTDNPHLDPSYIRNLQSLPEKMRKAYLEGDWNVFEGQYFSEWSDKVHVVQPFPIPPTWKKYRTYDHGRDHPAVCLWIALDHDGRCYVYRELYVRGKNIDEIAKEIIERSTGEEYQYSIADNSIFAKTGFVDRWGGETIAEGFARNGIMFYPSSKRRIDGWALMHQYLHYTDTKIPKLLFFPNCVNSIRSIPTLIFDDRNTEDLDSAGDDDCADALRYFLQSLHEISAPKPKSELELKLEKMQEQQFNLNEFYYGS